MRTIEEVVFTVEWRAWSKVRSYWNEFTHGRNNGFINYTNEKDEGKMGRKRKYKRN